MLAQSSRRNDFIDYLKGALIFLVACGHAIQYVGYNDPSYYLDPLFKAIYTFHVPLFMAVSGFVSFRSISTRTFRSGTQRRFRQIIIPAVCWPMLYLLVLLAQHVLTQSTLAGGLHSFLNALPEFRSGLWFLWALFGSTVIVSALKAFRWDRLEFFLAATIVLLFAPDGAKIYLLKYTFPFFCLGYALAKGDQIRVPTSRSAIPVACALVTSIVCYLLWRTDTYIYTTGMHLAYANLHNILFRYFASLVISATFVRLVFGFYQIVKSRTLSNWGRSSLNIYVIHIYLVKILATINHPLRGSLWFTFLVSPIVAWILCLACYQGGQYIGAIPLARTLLLGRIPEPPQSTQKRPANTNPTGVGLTK